MVSGDFACCLEARELVHEIEVTPVKEGTERGPATGLTPEQNQLHNGAAAHLSPLRARELIEEKAEAGLRRLKEIPKFWLDTPYELVSVLRRTETEPQKTAVCRADDLLEVLQMPRQYE
jgi:D-aminopeptidase